MAPFALLEGVVKAARWALLGSRSTARRAAGEEMRRLLGVEDRNVDYRAGVLHPLSEVPGTIGPDDSSALVTLAGPAYRSARDRGRLEIVDSIDVRLDQGQVLIGSPETEAVTRLAYGYRRRADGAGMIQDALPRIRLPYRWEEDATQVTAQSCRYVPVGGYVPGRTGLSSTQHAVVSGYYSLKSTVIAC